MSSGAPWTTRLAGWRGRRRGRAECSCEAPESRRDPVLSGSTATALVVRSRGRRTGRHRGYGALSGKGALPAVGGAGQYGDVLRYASHGGERVRGGLEAQT